MATIRRAGFGSVFEVENEKVGIGTTGTATNTLQVLGETRASDAKIIGLSTLTTYQGFLDKDAKLGTTVSDFEKKSGSLNNTIIDGDVNVSSASTLTTSLNQLTMTDSFSVPTGNTDNRIHCHTAGSMRFNEDLGTLEFYTGDEWRTVNSFKDTGSRGICMLMGGDVPSRVDFAHYVNIMTQGNSISFGDLNTAISQSGGGGNAIRAMTFGGSLSSGNSDEIQYTTIGTKGKFQDFGDLSSGRQTVAVVSTSVQATATAGATSGDTVQNIIEFVNIMTIGNAIDFGDLLTQRRANGAFGSPVRGVVVAGCTPTIFGNVEFFIPQSRGNATNWGEMTDRRSPYAFSNSVRGIIAGGFNPAVRLNIIEYLTIASAGTNASDFGDLTQRKDAGGANGHSSNQIRGLITGGYEQPSGGIINNIDFINIATAGNALDFGECSQKKWGYVANTTDSHGGLGGF